MLLATDNVLVRNVPEACGGGVSCRNLQPRGFEVAIRLPSFAAPI